MRFRISLLFAMALVGTYVQPVSAGNHTVTGSIGIETPIGQTPDRPQDDSPMVKLDLHLNRLIGAFGFYGGANVNTKAGLPYMTENKFWTGIELPIGKQGLVAYSYYERRYDVNANRFMIGCRYNFHSGY
jgi:hypothetical protein